MVIKGSWNVEGQQGAGSHGGTGNYFVRTLLTDEFESSMKYIRDLLLEPGSSIGIHAHSGDEEIYYIISGTGMMQVDGEEKKVQAGDVVLTKSGSSHGLRNDSTEDLRIFVACARTGQE